MVDTSTWPCLSRTWTMMSVRKRFFFLCRLEGSRTTKSFFHREINCIEFFTISPFPVVKGYREWDKSSNLRLVAPVSLSGHRCCVFTLIITMNDNITVIPLKFVREIFNFLLSSLIFISPLLQERLHFSKSQSFYFYLQRTCQTVSGQLHTIIW